MSRPTVKHSRLLFRASLTSLGLFVIAAVILVITILLQGTSLGLLTHPIDWLNSVDAQTATEAVSTAAELLAAILAIAITVVAIVVELAANRYSHRITSLFVREPINIVVMSFFVVATIHSIWIGLTLSEEPSSMVIPNAGLFLSMAMVTASLIILLPYFAFVLSFLSPVSFISKIRNTAIASLDQVDPNSVEKAERQFQESIDELQNIARRASELSDRAIAMASINAMAELLLIYETRIDSLPKQWFEISDAVAADPDFVSLSSKSLRHIEETGTWVEAKILRRYMDLILCADTDERDISYIIAINTRRIGISAIDSRPALIDLSIRFFNSYLRATINNKDQRTTYYIMNQYRLLAEELLKRGRGEAVCEIALHFQFYGLLGFKSGMPFLLEVAAYDIVNLIEECVRSESSHVDRLLDLLLELDQEIKNEETQESLLGVRRAQLQLATFLVEHGDQDRARRVGEDLKSEKRSRLESVRDVLLAEERSEFWEFTDRGVNFSYLEPKYRAHLNTIFDWIDE